MKLTIKLEWDETEAGYAELDFTHEDILNSNTCRDAILTAWAVVRGNYLDRKHEVFRN